MISQVINKLRSSLSTLVFSSKCSQCFQGDGAIMTGQRQLLSFTTSSHLLRAFDLGIETNERENMWL